MRSLSVVLLIASAAVNAKDAHISFSSRRQIGKLPDEASAAQSLVMQAVQADLDTKGVTFSSERIIGGNWQDYSPKDPENVTFTSQRTIGLLEDDGEETAILAKARENHHGVTFTSQRQIGLFSQEGSASAASILDQYTLQKDADEEEEKAVTSATLATFFVTWFVAMIFGMIIAICCCVKKCGLLANKDPRIQVELRDDGSATPQLSQQNEGVNYESSQRPIKDEENK